MRSIHCDCNTVQTKPRLSDLMTDSLGSQVWSNSNSNRWWPSRSTKKLTLSECLGSGCQNRRRTAWWSKPSPLDARPACHCRNCQCSISQSAAILTCHAYKPNLAKTFRLFPTRSQCSKCAKTIRQSCGSNVWGQHLQMPPGLQT